MSDERLISPIVCRMDVLSADERSRRSEVASMLRGRLAERSETREGIAFRWLSDDSILPLLAEFVSLESRCCPFIRFRIEVEAEGGPIELHLGGRDGVKDFLAATFMQNNHA